MIKVLIDPDELVGMPYDAMQFNCWTFIETCLDVPKIGTIVEDMAEATINENIPYFLEITKPTNYCLVILGKKHIGIYKDGHVYHNDRDMVKCESLRAMKRKYAKIAYYTKD